MTFYQELQLNQAGSKLMIQEAVGRRAKAWHLLVYLVKILLTMVFCVAFVTLYGWVFGAENNIVGVVVLLCLMVFRQADLGMRRGQSLLALGLVFLVLAFGPRLANLAELGGELAVHGLSLLVILVLGSSTDMAAIPIHMGRGKPRPWASTRAVATPKAAFSCQRLRASPKLQARSTAGMPSQ